MNIQLKNFCPLFLSCLVAVANLQAAAPDSLLNIVYSAGFNPETDQLRLKPMLQKIEALRLQNHPFITVKIGGLQAPEHARDTHAPATVKFDVMMPDFDALIGGADYFSRQLRARSDSTPLILTNLQIDSLNGTTAALSKLVDDRFVREYIVLEKQGYRIGVFAVLGNEVIFKLQNSPGLRFKDPEMSAQQASRFLQFHEKVDFIVGLTFSGMRIKPGGRKWTGESQYLGVKAPDIDVIISSGTNCSRVDSILSKDTPVLQMADDRTELNFATVAIAGTHRRVIDRGHWRLGDAGNINSPLVQHELPVSGLGNFVTDAMLQFADQKQRPVDFAFLLNENLRQNLQSVKRSHQFSLSLAKIFPQIHLPGSKSSGLPLVHFYLDGEDLQKAMELNSSIYPLKGANYFMHIAGLQVSYNTRRIIFNRVVRAQFDAGENRGAEIAFDENHLYAIVSDWITAARLQSIYKMASGFLRITLRDSSGEVVENLSALQMKPEVNLQLAVGDFWENLGDVDGDGFPDIPQKYFNPQPRILVSTTLNFADLFHNPSIVMVVLIIISCLMIIGVAAVIVVLIRRIRG